MADFYSEMAIMARDLLAPTSAGGLGQGAVSLQRIVIDEDDPWGTPDKTTKEDIRCAVRGIEKEMIGAESGGTVLVASDRVAICEVPDMDYAAGDELIIDSKPVQIISFERIPAAGITSAVRFVIRG